MNMFWTSNITTDRKLQRFLYSWVELSRFGRCNHGFPGTQSNSCQSHELWDWYKLLFATSNVDMHMIFGRYSWLERRLLLYHLPVVVSDDVSTGASMMHAIVATIHVAAVAAASRRVLLSLSDTAWMRRDWWYSCDCHTTQYTIVTYTTC